MATRMEERYKETVIAGMKERFNYTNDMAIPRIEKVVLSQGLGKANVEKKRLEEAINELSLISGQKPVITKAKKAVSNFKVRVGMNSGTKVTIRRKNMFEFLDKLITIAIPRIKDFRGVSPKSFDGCGNFSMGVSEQSIFPEINPDKVTYEQGLNITITTTAKTDIEGFELLKQMGMPFRDGEPKKAKAGKQLKKS